VKLHGGTILCESAVGRGTSFVVRIPLGTAHLVTAKLVAAKLANEMAASTRALTPTSIRADAYVEEALQWLSDKPAAFEELPGELAAHKGTRILLADDNADMRGYIRRLLERSCQVEAVADGYEALEAIKVQLPDLILTDVMMPNLDGFGLLRAIRSNPDWREIPVLMLSARAGEESRVEGLEAGADDYLVKPFSSRELTARVASLLELTRLRREAMMALRASEQRMRGLFRQAPGFSCILQGPEHVYEFANESYVRLIGARDLIGKTVRQAMPEVEGQGFFELLDEVYRSGEPVSGLETPLRLRRSANGPLELVLIDFIYQPITDAGGQVTGIFVEGFDVTDRVQAQAALRESETRYRTLFNSIDEGFCILEAMGGPDDGVSDYRYIAANPALKVQSGIAVNVGHDTVRGLLGGEAQSWIDAFEEIRRSGEPLRAERNLVTQGRILDLYSFRLEDETNRRIGVIFTDITERKRAEAELLRANQDLEQFAYSASHDLQEPLRSVRIYSELLAQRFGPKLEGQARDFLEFLTAGATRMEMLVRDLLAYTQSGQKEHAAEPAEATEALTSALANLAAAIKTSNARVTFDPLPAVRIHGTQLQQLFQNLIGNAIKYSRDSVTPEIHVGVAREEDRWVFSVSDNGLGIDPEYKERIFGLFKRLHTGDQYSGTGIGLAICQRIVERAHGRIWVESEIGRGSTFRFTIPV
jgi:signal transduction histidine kinase/CheY-like chemotaxis protein